MGTEPITIRLDADTLFECKHLSKKKFNGKYQSFIKEALARGISQTRTSSLFISNIPNEIYMVAIQYEGYTLPDDIQDAKRYYEIDSDRAGFTNGGLEQAISDYLLRNNHFADGGEYEETADDGYTLFG